MGLEQTCERLEQANMRAFEAQRSCERNRYIRSIEVTNPLDRPETAQSGGEPVWAGVVGLLSVVVVVVVVVGGAHPTQPGILHRNETLTIAK